MSRAEYIAHSSFDGLLAPIRSHWMPSEQAVETILIFEERFGPAHSLLACYAAFPLILTAELVNLIRINFLDDRDIPWHADADFLLAPFCYPIDTGLYQVDPSARELLLADLIDRYQDGPQRLLRLADFLIAYLDQQNNRHQKPEITRLQRWVAWSYLEPKRVVGDLREILRASPQIGIVSQQIGGPLEVAIILETLREPLRAINDDENYRQLEQQAAVIVHHWYDVSIQDLPETEVPSLLADTNTILRPSDSAVGKVHTIDEIEIDEEIVPPVLDIDKHEVLKADTETSLKSSEVDSARRSMPRMIPDPFHVEPHSIIERRLYDAFHSQLSEGFIVFHRPQWKYNDRRGNSGDAEADFVIAHPDFGILVVEVKGGFVKYDRSSQEWFSGHYKISNPFQQARTNMYKLLNTLKSRPFWRNRWITMGYAVGIPDAVINRKQFVGPQVAREIILDNIGLMDLESWVRKAFEYYIKQDGKYGALGHMGGIEDLIQLFSYANEQQSPSADLPTVEQMAEWFFENFEDPVESVPYESAEGGYQYLPDEPYDAAEELASEFPNATEKMLQEAVEEIETQGGPEWVKKDRLDDTDERTDEQLSNESSVIYDMITDVESILSEIRNLIRELRNTRIDDEIRQIELTCRIAKTLIDNADWLKKAGQEIEGDRSPQKDLLIVRVVINLESLLQELNTLTKWMSFKSQPNWVDLRTHIQSFTSDGLSHRRTSITRTCRNAIVHGVTQADSAAERMNAADEVMSISTDLRNVGDVASQMGSYIDRAPVTFSADEAHFNYGHALLIGVGNYVRAALSIPQTATEARQLADLLRDPTLAAYPYSQVRLLTDQAATRRGILDALENFALQLANAPQPTALLFFTCHGQYQGDEYWLLPHDYDPEDLLGTAIDSITLRQKIEAIAMHTHRLLILLNCSYAGGIGDSLSNLSAAPPKSFYEPLAGGRGRVIISSSRPGELSGISSTVNLETTIFGTHLLAALRGKAPGQGLTIGVFELFSYLSKQVPLDARRILYKGKPLEQHPLLYAHEIDEDWPVTLRPYSQRASIL